MRNTFTPFGLFRSSDDLSSRDALTPATDVDEVNADSDKAKLLRMSGQIDVNEFTIQGAHGPQSEATIREEKQKYEDRRRAFAQIFSNPFIADCVAAFLRATPHYNHGLSAADIAAQKELRTFARYVDVELEFDAEKGPSMLGYHERRINELERYFHGDNPVPADKCHSQVCVLREIEHSHSGGLKNKTAPALKGADDVDDIIGNEKQGAPVTTTPAAAPALHLQ